MKKNFINRGLQSNKYGISVKQNVNAFVTVSLFGRMAGNGRQQVRRQRGGQWCPAPPFEIGAPPFHVWPTGCCIHPILYIKNVAPLLVYGLSFWFLVPPAAKSWRRAW